MLPDFSLYLVSSLGDPLALMRPQSSVATCATRTARASESIQEACAVTSHRSLAEAQVAKWGLQRPSQAAILWANSKHRSHPVVSERIYEAHFGASVAPVGSLSLIVQTREVVI